MKNYRELKRLLQTGRRWRFRQSRSYSLSSMRSTEANRKSFLDAENYKQLRLDGYRISKITEIPEYSALAVELVHEKSGAQHLHIARDDQNNVFSVAFRTAPLDNTGVSHILEHTVLCGSKMFPVRDPFFKMLNRSLSTFMNAMTASDWTMYPFSTQSAKDYQNLMSVYLDAVFFPNLNEMDFRQEGWRLEHSDPHNDKSEIIFKGVVFNEMKGALSTAERIFYSLHQTLLLPSHTYGYESGGDPLHIPHLTWEQLKNFHSSAYHPSNARFYTYGNFPLENSLQQIEGSVLQYFEKIHPGTDIPVEPRWDKERTATITCPPDPLTPDPEKQHMVSVSYMLHNIEDPFDSFIMNIISTLLVDGPNSPFYQALIESNIGSEYTPVVGVDSSTKNPSFGVGLQGIHENDIQKVLDIIKDTFLKVYSDGFDDERIESILHSAELAKKHQTSNFGLGLNMGLASYWTHGNNPVDFLSFDQQVQRFRQTLSQHPSYLQKKVKEYFLDNSHKLTLIMKPEDDYNEKKEIEEKKLLEDKISSLSQEDLKALYADGLELDKQQNAKEDISCLPKMLVSDINKDLITTHMDRHLQDQNVEVYTCEQPTNEITYFRAVSTTSSLPYVLKPYLPLFCKVLTKLGAGRKNHKELAQAIEMSTGGLSASPHLVAHHTNEDQFELGVSFSSYCLKQNIPMMFSLWQDVLNEPRFFEYDYLKTLINGYANDLAMSVANSGHAYAMASASKHLNLHAQLAELFGGISQVEFMKEVAEKGDLDETIENLMKIATYMLNANEMRCLINTVGDQMDASLVALECLLNSLNAVGFDDEDHIYDRDFNPKSHRTFIPMDFPVNYVSTCIPGVPYAHDDHAKLQVLAKIMSAKYLHREIREKGGAYGSGARHGGGIFSFFSFRDPNTKNTLEAFNESIKWAGDGRFSDDDIEEAKLSIFSSVDSPTAPGNRGMLRFKSGLTDEIRQLHRNQLFSANRDDLVSVCNRYLIEGKKVETKAIIGPKNDDFLKDSSWHTAMNIQS